MNCASTKRQQSTTTTAINNTEAAPFTSTSPSPLLVTSSIEQRNYVANSDSNIITTSTQCSDIKKERPTPPPRSGRAQKYTTAAAPAQQTLMIKNIENISTHANAEEKDEEKEEKDICCGPNRKSSITEDIGAAQVNKLKPIEEGTEESKAINTNTTATDNDAANVASGNVQELGGGDSKLPYNTLSSTTVKVETTEHAPNSSESESNLVSTGSHKSTQNSIKFSTVSETLESLLSDTDKAHTKENRDSVVDTTADGLLHKTIAVESPLSRDNSTSSVFGKTKLSKTPSFSKLSSSLQSSLGTLSGSRPDEDTISKSSDTSGELVRGICDDSSAVDKPKGGSRLSERAKKKSWYNVLYPNYKSRAEDFKKLFKEVPSEERLIVDYSCALQRDILVQGRLYVSQNYVCFHANIFRWETYLTIRWKDVTSITKEKTALVIPNAISICTANEKYFFATFTTRDKAFLMLFRVWQNTLMNKQMLPQEIWQWVHNCYGDELGLTTDDEEDYIDPTTVPTENEGDIDYVSALEDANSIVSSTLTSDYNTTHSTLNANISGGNSSSTSSGGGGATKSRSRSYFFSSNKSISNSLTTTSTSGSDNKASDNNRNERESINTMNAKELTLTSVKPDDDAGKSKMGSSTTNESGSGASKDTKSSTLKAQTHEKRKVSKSTRVRDEAASNNQTNLPTDVSGSSDSEENKTPFVATAECTSAHEGRQLVHTILPINVDTLFNLLFSKSKFLMEFHAMRKTENMSFGEWVTDEDGKKTRAVSLTVQLIASVGPKAAKVTETQEMRDCSKPGELYSIDITSVNAGIPYADSFSVLMHYCFVRTVDDHTMLSVHAQIKYKKSIWGVVKGFIEKNTWAGLEEYFNAMQQALQSETCIPPAKAKGRRPRRGTAAQARPAEEVPEAQTKSEAVEVAVATSRRNVPRLPLVTAQQSAVDPEPQNKHKWLSVFVIGLLCFLIVLNVILLLKLWTLEERIDEDVSNRARLPNLAALRELPNSNEEWVELLRQQEILHEAELKKWHKVLQTAIELLKKTERTLAALIFR
ncbi:protein Aster-B isoform X2 [Zeugodacus cucurbitae]|uniref:protein Aster-B isoform X2 n=1 Tax=Zeugodacus cucurbitae TaxID=28588 RepID=UPI0023D91D8D|nr:protein Aster-B isoform X2 [Zeugodacus cucurbitae]